MNKQDLNNKFNAILAGLILSANMEEADRLQAIEDIWYGIEEIKLELTGMDNFEQFLKENNIGSFKEK